jgi:hypothetical protein
MKKKRMIVLVTGIVISLVIMIVALFPVRKPPIQEITQARQKLAEADMVQASQFALDLYNAATLQFDSAMLEWERLNRQFFLVRNFKRVKLHAQQSRQLAIQAILQSNIQLQKTGQILDTRIHGLEEQIETFELKYGHFPYSEPDMARLSRARLLLSEGTLACKQGNFTSCETKLDAVEMIMGKLYRQYDKALSLYFQQYPTWNKWVEGSIAYSRKNKTMCIIIDKYSRSCLLYRNGTLQNSYEIELGTNWIGDKNQQGDKSTPEGIYKIVRKKSGSETKYHKAFLLDYPNAEDLARFRTNKTNGTISRSAEIGHSIEIHGHGGKGADWTDGCIALNNADMDELYRYCSPGTRVTIVGSVVPLETILSNLEQ